MSCLTGLLDIKKKRFFLIPEHTLLSLMHKYGQDTQPLSMDEDIEVVLVALYTEGGISYTLPLLDDIFKICI